MAKKSLIDYVRSQLQKGYSNNTIRDVMLKYGYTSKEIDDAIKSSQGLTIRHEIHLSNTTIIAIVLVIASIISGILFFHYKPTAAKPVSKLLDLNLEPLQTTAEPGEMISFLKEISNLGSSTRYDVVIRQEIIEENTNRVITQKIETRAIETFGSSKTQILIPVDTRPGSYILRAIVEYDSKKAVATLPVKIMPTSIKATCFDGIKNQDETNADCGGICKPCEQQDVVCDDNNPCTNDVVENKECSNVPIVPCCGNNICEEQENCEQDCRKVPQFSELPSTETIDEIKDLARSEPAKALQQCNQLEIPDFKDTCISNIAEVQSNKNYCLQIKNERIKDLCYLNTAKSSNDNSICQDITSDARRDSCYMTFVLDNKDYSVCDRITNSNLRYSCESLRQLYELNQQSQNQTPSEENVG